MLLNSKCNSILFSSIIAFVFCSFKTHAADYYWVGNAGNWSDYANHWATTDGGTTFHTVAPTAADDVYFTAQSFTTANNIVTIDGPSYCHDLNAAGIATQQKMNFTFPAKLYIDGSLTTTNKLNVSVSSSVLEFTSNSPGNTINSNGTSIPADFYFTGTGEWTILSNLTVTNAYLQSGTLNTNGFTIHLYSFYSVTNNLRKLDLGNSYINAYYWTVDNTSNNFTLIKGNSKIESTHFNGGGLTYANFSIDDLEVADVGGNNTFDTIFVSNFKQVNFEGGKTQTANALIQANAASCYFRVTLAGSNGIATLNVPSGNITFNDIIINDVIATGGASFNAVNSYGLGNTNGWNISSGPVNRDIYWVGDAGTWSDGAHWSLTSGGAPINCVPGPFDNVIFDQNSFTTGAQDVSVDIPAYCKTMDWSQAQNAPKLYSYEFDINVSGSLLLNSSMIEEVYSNINFISDSTGNIINMAGIDLIGGVKFKGKGDWTLASNFTDLNYSAPFMLWQGTFNSNGYLIDFPNCEFQSWGDSAKVFNIKNNKARFASWSAQSLFTLLDSNATIEMTSNGNFIGKQMHYNHVNFTGSNGYTIYNNNTFDTLTLAANGVFSFYISTTQNVSVLNVLGSANLETTLESTTAGTQANINLTGGNFCGDYLKIRDIASTGDHFFAGTNSIDNGNNSKVYFMACTNPLAVTVADSMHVKCHGDSTAWVKVSVFGGLTPYNYSWNTGATADSIGGLKAGVYTVHVWDQLSDTVSLSITITQPSLVVNFSLSVDTVCSSSSLISLTANPSGGTFSGDGVIGSSFDPLSVTNFGMNYISYSYTNSNGCVEVATDSIYVNVCTGINNNIGHIISLFPNPVINAATITTTQVGITPITITNVIGDVVYVGSFDSNLKIDLSTMPSGIYTVKTGTGDKMAILKMVKQ